MTEKNLVIDGLELDYEGVFDMGQLLAKIDEAASKKGYSSSEKRREEHVTPSGKEFHIELRPTKRMSEDDWLTIKMRIFITNLKDVAVVREKRKVKLQSGKIHIIFDSFVFGSHEWKWEAPWFTFAKKLYEKIAYKIWTDKYEDLVSGDTHFVYDEIKGFLNLYRYGEERK